MKQQTTTTPKHETANGYRVTPQAAALLDCIREADALYTHILDALQPLRDYEGCDWEKEAEAEYLPHIGAISDSLNKELLQRITGSLSDTQNTKKDIIEL